MMRGIVQVSADVRSPRNFLSDPCCLLPRLYVSCENFWSITECEVWVPEASDRMSPEKQNNRPTEGEKEAPESLPPVPEKTAQDFDVTTDLSPRQLGQVRHLILSDALVSAETRTLARTELPLLINLSKLTAQQGPCAAETLEGLVTEIKAKGFTPPSAVELGALREILAEISASAGEVDAKALTLRRISATYAVGELEGEHYTTAKMVLECFGPSREIFQLATKLPQLFAEYVNAYQKCDRHPEDLMLQQTKDEVGTRIKEAGMHIPLNREMRKFFEKQSDEKASDESYNKWLAASQTLLSKFANMGGVEKEIARGVLMKFGPENILFKFAVQMPEEFRRYVQLATAAEKSPSDSEIVAEVRDLKLHLRVHDLIVPVGKVLKQCRAIIEKATVKDQADIIRAIQAEIDQADEDGFEVDDWPEDS